MVSVRDAELHCEVRGVGPVCLVPSAIGTGPYVRMMPAPLVDLLTLVHVDLRGGGRSTGDPASLTFEQMADDFEAVRTELGVPRVAILGHSALGILAIEYGRRRPDSVSHVIAVGTPPFGDMGRLSAFSNRLFEQEATDERKQVLRENLANLSPNAPAGEAMFAQTPMRFFDPRFDARPLFADAEVRPALFAQLFGRLIQGWDVRTDAGSLRRPLLLAHGRSDYTVPAALWEGLVEALPDATLRLFDRSGHQPFFEEPEALARAVEDWMKRPDSS